jgi:hypothetical protein
LVMERVIGPSMVASLGRRPWTVRQHGNVLADLHQRLHDIPAPDWLPPAPFGDGDRLVHLDLHPLNVIVSANGPVVIDWPGAARGAAATDVALTWILLAAGEVPSGRFKAALLGRVRGLLINSFLRRFDLADVRPHLAEVVGWKVNDPHMSAAGQEAMWRLVRAEVGRA